MFFTSYINIYSEKQGKFLNFCHMSWLIVPLYQYSQSEGRITELTTSVLICKIFFEG